ncbi:MAG: hypothetical protein PWQ57_3014 [Desulfovibrionales bacterium]|nr:hypothetical protein [Desulfovibrionales bacterium]
MTFQAPNSDKDGADCHDPRQAATDYKLRGEFLSIIIQHIQRDWFVKELSGLNGAMRSVRASLRQNIATISDAEGAGPNDRVQRRWPAISSRSNALSNELKDARTTP